MSSSYLFPLYCSFFDLYPRSVLGNSEISDGFIHFRERMGDLDDSIKLDDDDLLSTTGNSVADMADLSSIEQQMEEFEEEQRKIKQMQSDIEGQMNLPRSSNGTSSPAVMTPEEKAEADSRSVYIGNVDYSVTAEELEKHFHGCGSVARVTILCDKYTGHPKGYVNTFTSFQTCPASFYYEGPFFLCFRPYAQDIIYPYRK
ncbi:hypothetical protein ANCCAN_21935 [Ancylostoma caninum]|uniref:RRM domain-containing protein n=1 Tax=Ancylostoma caninum TaxID=29170 RepID=A0A368FJM4_ANCCA|nr:hypothetical protein ANCCAN_21935 [Ancylostoma caninum]